MSCFAWNSRKRKVLRGAVEVLLLISFAASKSANDHGFTMFHSSPLCSTWWSWYILMLDVHTRGQSHFHNGRSLTLGRAKKAEASKWWTLGFKANLKDLESAICIIIFFIMLLSLPPNLQNLICKLHLLSSDICSIARSGAVAQCLRSRIWLCVVSLKVQAHTPTRYGGQQQFALWSTSCSRRSSSWGCTATKC